MVKKGQIILNEEKRIQGRDQKAGTVLAEIDCQKAFTIEDVDLSIQLGQAKVIPIAEESKKK